MRHFVSGYFCPEGTASIPSISNPTGTPSVQNLCPKGYFCPDGTTEDEENACRIGTYNPELGRASDVACLTCEEGKYCEAGESYFYVQVLKAISLLPMLHQNRIMKDWKFFLVTLCRATNNY